MKKDFEILKIPFKYGKIKFGGNITLNYRQEKIEILTCRKVSRKLKLFRFHVGIRYSSF